MNNNRLEEKRNGGKKKELLYYIKNQAIRVNIHVILLPLSIIQITHTANTDSYTYYFLM